MQQTFDELLERRSLELQGVLAQQIVARAEVPVRSACAWCDNEFVRIRTGTMFHDGFCSSHCRELYLR